jgi:hypothetical protein
MQGQGLAVNCVYVRNNFASVKKGGISGPLYKNQLQDMGLIPKEPK